MPAYQRFKVIDKQNAGMELYPSTSEMAEETLSQYLNDQAKKGWVFRSFFYYQLGRENRTCLVFERERGVTPEA
jgi:Domain of unknown function (DUF4177)